ncbi:flagellar motor switch protein FliM [Candidatus Poribacteria bacterium]|nr:flagellar motor switch protein FliM [Candidatus Poribacteria bacterium]
MEKDPSLEDEIKALQDEIESLLNSDSSSHQLFSDGKSRTVDPLLSQDEVDTLLTAMSSNAPAPTPSDENISVEKYDFIKPTHLTREHIKSISALHSNFARNLGSILSSILRTPVEVNCSHIEQLNYGEYLTSLLDPSCIGIFSISPMKSYGVIDMNPTLVFPMIDMLLGGTGSVGFYSRGLTKIEENIIANVMKRILEILQEIWLRNMEGIKINMENLESSPQFVHAASHGDPMVLVLFDIKFDDIRNMMSLCFPFLTIQQLLANIQKEEYPEADEKGDMKPYKVMMRKHVDSVPLNLSVRYESNQVTLGELLELQKGDIVKLQNADKNRVLVYIEDKGKFQGKPGMVNGRRAVQIFDAVEGE